MSLTSQLASAQRRLQELSSEADTVLSRHQAQAREDAAVLRVKMEQVQGEGREPGCRVRGGVQGERRGHKRVMEKKIVDVYLILIVHEFI